MDFVINPGLDPAHDVLQYGRQALDAIFAPKSVAVIGATETQLAALDGRLFGI